MMSAKPKIMLAVVSSCVTSPLTVTVRRSGLVRSASGSIQGPTLPEASKFLPWVTLNLPCRSQSPTVPSFGSVARALARDVAAGAADHQRDLALVVELLRHLRPHQRLAVRDQRVGRAIEHAGILRHVGIVEIEIAVGVVDADAEDLFRRHQRRQQLDLGERVVGPYAEQRSARLMQRMRPQQVDQGRVPRAEAEAQVAHAVAQYRAIARSPAHIVTGEPHGAPPSWANIARPRSTSRRELVGSRPPRVNNSIPKETLPCRTSSASIPPISRRRSRSTPCSRRCTRP